MRAVAIALLLLAASACDDDCTRDLSAYCDRHACVSYDQRVAGRVEVSCPPDYLRPHTTVWSCGTLRAIEEGDGFVGWREYYDTDGKLVAALAYGDTPDDNGCFEYAYGRDGLCTPPQQQATCLVAPR